MTIDYVGSQIIRNSKQRPNIKAKNVVGILNAVKKFILDLYLNCGTISKLTKNINIKDQTKC